MTNVDHCQDPECKATIAQPKTGRPRLYCDATCRKNAARYRAVIAWRVAHREWEQREAQRARIREVEQRAWDAYAVPGVPDWQAEALAAGWTPPEGLRAFWHRLHVDAYGPRPADYRTPSSDPEPIRPPDYRMGRKTEYGW